MRTQMLAREPWRHRFFGSGYSGVQVAVVWWGLDDRELVTELFFFCREVPTRGVGDGHFDWQHLADDQSVAGDAGKLARIVGEQAHRADAEVPQDLDGHAIVA